MAINRRFLGYFDCSEMTPLQLLCSKDEPNLDLARLLLDARAHVDGHAYILNATHYLGISASNWVVDC
jgi:hypothetical protein